MIRIRLTASVALLFCLILGLQAAQTVKTVTSVTSSITISEAWEYHITASNNCIADGATINITNQDAWVVFDNVQPAAVISTWMSKVTVNGEALVQNTNCFINVYKHGTAILPHGSNYEPLTVYTGELYGGEAKTFKPGKYTALGTTFNKAIKSLKIKRGYMVTVAQSATGAGYSRVFMAHDSDIEISNLADSKQCTNGSALYNKISFIRVSRLNMPDKKGTIRPGDPNDLNCSWYYNYDCGTGTGTANAEFVPEFHHVGWNSWAATGTQSDISGITHALGFNEPWNDPGNSAYMGTDPYVCVPYQYEAVKTGRRVGTMAPNDGTYGNLYSFVDSCDRLGLRLDFVVVHYYRSQSALNGNAASFLSQIKAIYDRTKRPVWITEFNNGANWTTETWPTDSLARLTKQKLEFGAMCDALNSAPYVERYSVYQDVENFRMMKINGVLTPAGEYYKSMKPGFAYNSAYEYIPTLPKAWNYTKPTVTVNKANITRNGQVTLTYKEVNEGYFDRCVLERKIGKGDFKEIKVFTDVATTSYKDQLNMDSLRTTVYRFSCYYNNVTTPKYTLTETISFNSAEASPVRFGTAEVGELDLSTVGFDEFADTGKVAPIIGAIPVTTAMSVPFVYGMNALVEKNSFRFKLAPWGYTYNYNATTRASLTPTASVSVPFFLASTEETSLGDLPVEAGIVSGVLDDQWINVTFKKPFAEIPVVLTSIRSDQNYGKNVAPVYTRVRNITTDGFQLRLTREALLNTNSANWYLLGETVSYYAVTPGTTKVLRPNSDGVAVDTIYVEAGVTGEEVRSSSTICNFTQAMPTVPTMISALQTSVGSDAVTCGLAYTNLTTAGATFLKKRECSDGGSSLIRDKDAVGYLLFSVVPDTRGNAIEEVPLNTQHDFEIFIDGDYILAQGLDGKQLSIFNAAGTLQMVVPSEGAINVSQLVKGYYVARSEKGETSCFIKK